MDRRLFVRATLAAGLAHTVRARKQHRAAVIGHTGRGDYGHGLDGVCKTLGIPVAAVADPDGAGLSRAIPRTGASRGYHDYREMLRKERPDLVVIAPRWMDQNADMVEAVADAGAHIYMEKPFARDLLEADRMVDAVRRNRVKLQLAHNMRCSPFLHGAQDLIKSGAIGQIHELRGRGKEDHRVGGEDLMVLGSHICDVFRILAGNPQWVVAHVTEDGEEMERRHVRRPTEPIGPIAGNQIAAMFAFADGLHGYFASRKADQTDRLRFGTQILGAKGIVYLENAIYPAGRFSILRSPAWLPDETHRWEKIDPKFDSAVPERIYRDSEHAANSLMLLDLLDAIENDRKPICDEEDGRWTVEMISGIYRAQITGERVRFPSEDRRHPLRQLGA